MIYRFSDFELDTERRTLTASSGQVSLTRQAYDLLLYFVGNPNAVISKDALIEHVWSGRIVADNTVDQSVSKLRRILNQANKSEYIESVYGQGFKFLPRVETGPKKGEASSWRWSIAFALLLGISAIWVAYRDNSGEALAHPPVVMLMPAKSDGSEVDWAETGGNIFFRQLLQYSNIAELRDAEDSKPGHLADDDFLQRQWALTPEMQVITPTIEQRGNETVVNLSLVDAAQNVHKETITAPDLATALRQASLWVEQRFDTANDVERLIPDDSYVVELYLRGLSSLAQGQLDKAENFFELCLAENPGFVWARLELAKVKDRQGAPDQALALLDTLEQLSSDPAFAVAVHSLRGYILDTKGEHLAARDLYLKVLETYQGQPIPALNDVRFNLALTYATLAESGQALQQLALIEQSLTRHSDPELMADVLHLAGRIEQTNGSNEQARIKAETALSLFEDLGDLLGAAKTHSLLARIANHEARYDEAINHLETGLAITRKLNFPLGIGATLNELIYALMAQGKHDRAWELNQELEQIALDIDYTAMLLASKQFSVDMARAQQRWETAEVYLQQHLELAQASNNGRALIANRLLTLDLTLDQGKVDGVAELITSLQAHIDQEAEVRLQPRIDQHQARLYFLKGNDEQAIALLQSARQQARETGDGESLININNLLAEHFLEQEQPDKAMAALTESAAHDPVAQPYLMLMAQAQMQMGKPVEALELANQCKQKVPDLWTREDEAHLSEMAIAARAQSQ